ncbi:ribonuclease H-like domain-containing protein [Natronomonas sp. F2-12]|uniref:Ribonuclease H-like domain-containing protein n=1 Tax=Natronomonas aquatica TaxID=2841590 RepID=A0A9R1CWY5_9EURY|nr:ribonuclease H-like domain-containing protein [Natronomonas aquatica]MCQ4335011.1 ribonuclease H-like domain-containing protein [Natronomonas aquatica]
MPHNHRIAIDIETIPLVNDPDFQNPEHWTVFAVALGHAPPHGDTNVTVLFRNTPTLTAEGELINDTIDWIADRTDSGRTILSYNGNNYDLPVLRHRASRIDDVDSGMSVSRRLALLLDTSNHVDLIQDMKDRKGDWVSLDDALEIHQITADEPEWMGSKVTGAEMPSMGIELLSDRPNTDLRRVVKRYAASDVDPLFELHEKLTDDRVRD